MRVGFDCGSHEPERQHADLGPVFSAAFDSECLSCGFDIAAGDDVRYFEGEVMHKDCAEDEAGI